uniref:SCP domain-containing protein n=1 Tax=Megaselia scalaris TaxID=36166 RepID=T1H225_MEGSC
MKQMILDFHNDVRNTIACGEPELTNIDGDIFPKAAKMPRLSWNSELQWTANLNAKTCAFHHDCAVTLSHPSAGQNIGMAVSKNATDTLNFLRNTIKGFFAEYLNTPLHVIDKYSPSVISNKFNRQLSNKIKDSELVEDPETLKENAHFAVLVQDKSDDVACSMYSCGKVEDFEYSYYLVCNYGYFNLLNEPVYKTSNISGSECNRNSGYYCCLCQNDDVEDDEILCHPSNINVPHFGKSNLSTNFMELHLYNFEKGANDFKFTPPKYESIQKYFEIYNTFVSREYIEMFSFLQFSLRKWNKHP